MKTVMLQLAENRSRKSTRSRVALVASIIIVSVTLVGGGLYAFALYAAPSYMLYLEPPQTIDAQNLSVPTADNNRIVIPKLGIDIGYSDATQSLTNGQAWMSTASSTPRDTGTILIGARRLDIKTTPQQTVVASPFYHLDQLTSGDQIILDYSGKRYGYTVESVHTSQTVEALHAESSDSLLVLYTASADGSSDGRITVEARSLGEVSIETNPAGEDTL